MGTKYVIRLCVTFFLMMVLVAIFTKMHVPATSKTSSQQKTLKNFIVSAGVVETSSGNISIGTPITEIVEQVFVKTGDYVKEGEPLFKLNTTFLESDLEEKKAELLIIQAKKEKQLAHPRQEIIAKQTAHLKQAETAFLNKWTQYELVNKVDNPKAISRDEFNRKKYEAIAAKYSMEEAQGELDLVLAGTWSHDIYITRREIKQAQAKVNSILTKIDRSTIRAPLDGYVLKLNVKKGEIVKADEPKTIPIVFGSISPLHLRVSIDERDIWRIIPGAKGVAHMLGNKSLGIPIKYVRLEPHIINASSSRVLNLIYELDDQDSHLYPGMVLDVILEARPAKTK